MATGVARSLLPQLQSGQIEQSLFGVLEQLQFVGLARFDGERLRNQMRCALAILGVAGSLRLIEQSPEFAVATLTTFGQVVDGVFLQDLATFQMNLLLEPLLLGICQLPIARVQLTDLTQVEASKPPQQGVIGSRPGNAHRLWTPHGRGRKTESRVDKLERLRSKGDLSRLKRPRTDNVKAAKAFVRRVETQKHVRVRRAESLRDNRQCGLGGRRGAMIRLARGTSRRHGKREEDCEKGEDAYRVHTSRSCPRTVFRASAACGSAERPCHYLFALCVLGKCRCSTAHS